MNKPQLITALAEKSQITKKDAEKYINDFCDVVMDGVVTDGKVMIVGFGSWEKEEVKGRSGVMYFGVKKGQEWKSEDSFKPVFSPGKVFMDKVKGVISE